MKRSIYLLFNLAITGFIIAPMAYLFFLPKWEDYLSVFNHPQTLSAITNTFIVSISVSIISTLFGLLLAWLITRTDLPARNMLRTFFSLPYTVPAFIGAIGWIILANPNSGLLNEILSTQFNIYTMKGLIFVESTFLFTFSYLTTLAALDRMDSSLEEAALLSGASSLRLFFDIHLPLLKPSLISGFILSFLATAASFGVPALIGGPARLNFITTQIYTFQRMGTQNSLQLSIATSVLLALITFALLYLIQKKMTLQKNFIVSGKSSRITFLKLKYFKWPIFLMLIIIFIIIFILPISALLLSSLSSTQGQWDLQNITFNNYKRVLFETEETVRAISQSIILALAAASICTVVAFTYCYFTFRTQFKAVKFFESILILPFSTPGSILALAIIVSFSQGYFGIGPSLYNTLGLIVFAYVLKYLSLSVKTISDGYQQIHPTLEEAAITSGASWFKILKTIYFPLLKTAAIASVFLVFMPSLSELTMTLFLTGPGLETIGTMIFQFQEYSDMGGGGAAVLSILVITFVLITNFFLKFISKGRYGL